MRKRSYQTRRAFKITYYINTDEDKELARLKLTTTVSCELNATVELKKVLKIPSFSFMFHLLNWTGFREKKGWDNDWRKVKSDGF